METKITQDLGTGILRDLANYEQKLGVNFFIYPSEEIEGASWNVYMTGKHSMITILQNASDEALYLKLENNVNTRFLKDPLPIIDYNNNTFTLELQAWAGRDLYWLEGLRMNPRALDKNRLINYLLDSSKDVKIGLSCLGLYFGCGDADAIQIKTGNSLPRFMSKEQKRELGKDEKNFLLGRYDDMHMKSCTNDYVFPTDQMACFKTIKRIPIEKVQIDYNSVPIIIDSERTIYFEHPSDYDNVFNRTTMAKKKDVNGKTAYLVIDCEVYKDINDPEIPDQRGTFRNIMKFTNPEKACQEFAKRCWNLEGKSFKAKRFGTKNLVKKAAYIKSKAFFTGGRDPRDVVRIPDPQPKEEETKKKPQTKTQETKSIRKSPKKRASGLSR